MLPSPRPGSSGRASPPPPLATLLFLMGTIALGPGTLTGQSASLYASAWSDATPPGAVFEGVAIGLTAAGPAPEIFVGAPIEMRPSPATRHRSRFAGHHVGSHPSLRSCWVLWDPWYGYRAPCHAGWMRTAWVWAPPPRAGFWYARTLHRSPFWGLSIHVGRHAGFHGWYGWNGGWWLPQPIFVQVPVVRYPRVRYVYAPVPWLVQRPVVVHRAATARTRVPVRTAVPHAEFKEDPRPADPRRAVRRDASAAAPGSGEPAAAPPYFRTAPAQTARQATDPPRQSSSRGAQGVDSAAEDRSPRSPNPVLRSGSAGEQRGVSSPVVGRTSQSEADSRAAPETRSQPSSATRSQPSPATRTQPGSTTRSQPAPATRTQPPPATGSSPSATRSPSPPTTRGRPASANPSQPAPSTRSQPAAPSRAPSPPRATRGPSSAPSAGTASAGAPSSSAGPRRAAPARASPAPSPSRGAVRARP